MSAKAGLITLKANGETYAANGEFTYNLGTPIRETLLDAGGTVAGRSESPQENMIEGSIFDSSDINLKTLTELDNATITLELNNGKTIVQSRAWYAGDGSVGTKEGSIAFKSVGETCVEF